MLVHEAVADRFVELLLALTREWTYGDPMDPHVDMGTVIDEAAAKSFEARVNEAVARGAKLLHGNVRRGALVLADARRPCHARHAARQVRDLRSRCRR